MPVQLTETATGNHPKIAIVGQDGIPYPEVHYPVFENGTKLLIPPATRYAIAVTMPAEGDLILEMPPRGGGATTISAPGVLYTNDGTDNPPATLGSLSVLPSAVSYYDGFFVSPTQILARATTSAGKGRHHGVRRGAKARCLHRVRGHFQGHARLRARAGDLRRLSQRSRQHVRSQGLRLRLRRHGVSQRSLAPAAARLGRRVDVRQQQQRRASDPHSRQRLPGHALFRSDHGPRDRAGNVERRQCQRAGADHGRGGGGDPARRAERCA